MNSYTSKADSQLVRPCWLSPWVIYSLKIKVNSSGDDVSHFTNNFKTQQFYNNFGQDCFLLFHLLQCLLFSQTSLEGPFMVGPLSSCNKNLSSAYLRNFLDLLVTAVWHYQLMSGNLKSSIRTRTTDPEMSPKSLQNNLSISSSWLSEWQ